MFQADLVRALEMPLVCQFIKPKYTHPQAASGSDVMEIFSVTSPTFGDSTFCWWRGWFTPE